MEWPRKKPMNADLAPAAPSDPVAPLPAEPPRTTHALLRMLQQQQQTTHPSQATADRWLSPQEVS
jgi:hypothetical protein